MGFSKYTRFILHVYFQALNKKYLLSSAAQASHKTPAWYSQQQRANIDQSMQFLI